MVECYKSNLMSFKLTKHNYAKIRDSFFALLVFLMLMLPRNFQIVKVVIIFCIFIFDILSGEKNVTFNKIAILFIFYYLYAFIGVFLGYANNNPGVGGYFKVEVIWFSANLVVFSMFKKSTIKYVINAIIFASLIIAIYNILLLLFAIMGYNNTWLSQIDPTANVGLHEGYTHITSTNISMMMLTLPVVLGVCLCAENGELKTLYLNRIFLIIVVALTSFTMFLSGRRMLWLVMALTFFVFMFNNKHISKNLKRNKLIFYVCLLMISFLGIIVLGAFGKLGGLIQRFFDAFVSSGTEENIRTIEIMELWKGFLKKPIFGHGFGLGLGDIVPGYGVKYEVTYNEMLFNVGLVGSLMYAIFAIGLIIFVCKEIKKSKSLKNLLYIAFVILIVIFFASATNPYLGSTFDFYLFLFFPFAILKCSLIERRSCFKNRLLYL